VARNIIVGPDGYSTGVAAWVAGLNLRTLQRWTDQGVITPSVQQGQGKGSRDLFSFSDLVALRTFGRLRAMGLSLQAIKKALAVLRANDPGADLAGYSLVSDGREIYQKTGQQMRALVRRPGQLAFVWAIDLGDVQNEVRHALRLVA
jgi:DNA-binding transcriptional MerR regulator